MTGESNEKRGRSSGVVVNSTSLYYIQFNPFGDVYFNLFFERSLLKYYGLVVMAFGSSERQKEKGEGRAKAVPTNLFVFQLYEVVVKLGQIFDVGNLCVLIMVRGILSYFIF